MKIEPQVIDTRTGNVRTDEFDWSRAPKGNGYREFTITIWQREKMARIGDPNATGVATVGFTLCLLAALWMLSQLS